MERRDDVSEHHSLHLSFPICVVFFHFIHPDAPNVSPFVSITDSHPDPDQCLLYSHSLWIISFQLPSSFRIYVCAWEVFVCVCV